jgi:catechol 2,3-dioxygenase-like lactoylglutathione lyase family enzyme
MLNSQLSHICFSALDLGATENFYVNSLGFRVIHKFINNDEEIYGLIFDVGNSTFLEFFKSDYIPNDSTIFRHFCIAVSDLKKLITQLNSRNISCELTRGKTDNTMQTWITDPNGIKIEFHQYDAFSTLSAYIDLNQRRLK